MLYWPYDEQECEFFVAYLNEELDNAKIEADYPTMQEKTARYAITETNVTTLEHTSNGKNITKIIYWMKLKHYVLDHTPLYILPALSMHLLTLRYSNAHRFILSFQFLWYLICYLCG